jgi:hypothetical protein
MRRINLFDIFGTLSLIVGTLFFIFFVLILPRSWTGSNYEALMGLPAPTLIPTSDLPVLGNPAEIITATPIPVTDLIRALEDQPTDSKELARLTLNNESGSEICEIRLIADQTELDGIGLLRFQPPLRIEEQRHFEVTLGDYVLRAYDCTGREIGYMLLILEQDLTVPITATNGDPQP